MADIKLFYAFQVILKILSGQCEQFQSARFQFTSSFTQIYRFPVLLVLSYHF